MLAALAALFLVVGPATGQPIVDDWYVTVDYDENLIAGGGSGFNNGFWYDYPSGWWNQRFYDHPFDDTRWKEIHVEFDAYYVDDLSDAYLEFAVNWSTPEWSQLGFGDTLPPTPDWDETLYIMRDTRLTTDFFFPLPGDDYEHFVFDFIIPGYNPEWVSIDVYGWNFEIINGVIIHECVPEPATLALLAMGGLLLARRRR
jgi:hypothetical protein